ncbi:MAG: type II toxin-antitoxin system Phd/YefM family antitoxin [Geminicoccaceae bacterium]
MMVSVRRAKAKLSQLLERAAAGEEVLITKRGKPFVRLVVVADNAPRPPGLAKGRLTDAFFEPLPQDELEAWHQADVVAQAQAEVRRYVLAGTSLSEELIRERRREKSE